MTAITKDGEISLSNAKARLSELVDQVRTGAAHAIKIVKRRRPVAALVDIGTYTRLRELEDRVLREELREALKGKKRPLREVLKDMDLDL